jgi:leucine dehydrogenase
MKLFSQMSEMGHEQLVACHDKSSGYRGFIAIHDTTLGPALGGTRFWTPSPMALPRSGLTSTAI